MKTKINSFFTFLFCLSLMYPVETIAQWELVGQRKFTQGAVPQDGMKMMVHNGTPYIIYVDQSNDFNLEVVSFDGTNWNDLGPTSLPNENIRWPSIAGDNGTIYIAYQDINFSHKCSVMKYDGSSWTYVGNRGFSEDEARFQSIAIHNGEPYVAFEDASESLESTVMKYDGTNWVAVGTPGLTDGISGGQSIYNEIAFDDGMLYLVCNGVSLPPQGPDVFLYLVMKYDGANWSSLGVAQERMFSEHTSLDFYNGVPYISTTDPLSIKAMVKKYDGNNWLNVGMPGFSGDLAAWPHMVMHNGTPYVAYRDFSDSQKLTVMSYDGDSWLPTGGSTGISPEEMFGVELAIEGDKLYAAFKDTLYNFNPGRLTVMSFDLTTTNIEAIEKTKNDIRILPNPVANVLTVETEEFIESITVLSIDGKRLKTAQQKNINIHELPNGLYLLEVKTDKGLKYERFLKNGFGL